MTLASGTYCTLGPPKVDRGGGMSHQLQGGEVPLPPEVLLHVRPKPGQAVVRVHDDVDEGVQQADEERCENKKNAWKMTMSE